MIVSRADFDNVVSQLATKSRLATDTETSGLRMFHGDRLFSIIISDSEAAYYFNFIPYKDVSSEQILTPGHLKQLGAKLFALESITWYIQNAANFDLCIFGVDGIELAGPIHCTKAIGRVEYNDHYGAKAYSLDAQLKRLGRSKDDAVKDYIDKHELWTDVPIPGKDDTYRILHFDRVPWDIIVPYGETDAKETFFLGNYQEKSIALKDAEIELTPGRSMTRVMENEKRLQKTIYRMKSRGVLVDKPYCIKASAYETDLGEKARIEFKKLTGFDFKNSEKIFSEVFKGEKDKWAYTDKDNPSFTSDVLTKFENPAAREILKIRDSKSKQDFYNGFLWFSDDKGVVHPNYNPEGAIHGRFSSSEPNFQNLTSEEDEEQVAQEFIVRRAIIPRPGFVLIMPDYDQMEYKFMLEQACKVWGYETELAKMVLGGLDFHEATVQNTASQGIEIKRKEAKTVNFLTLYGGGDGKLAAGLKCSTQQARAIRSAIFRAAPEIQAYIKCIKEAAEVRGYIINWLGRRCYFANKNGSYRAPNYHISGGCADVVKIAMNEIDELLLGKKSKMIMSVHDELPIEVHESEIDVVPKQVKEIMENVYKHTFIKLTSGMEWSNKSLGDKIKGFPC